MLHWDTGECCPIFQVYETGIQHLMIIVSGPTNRRSLTAWLAILLLLLVLSSCSLTKANQSPVHTNQSATSTAMPVPTAVTPTASVPGVHSFIDSWNNFHIFQDFDYNIPNPGAIAQYYDFV
jgi:hypothetical protein